MFIQKFNLLNVCRDARGDAGILVIISKMTTEVYE